LTSPHSACQAPRRGDAAAAVGHVSGISGQYGLRSSKISLPGGRQEPHPDLVLVLRVHRETPFALRQALLGAMHLLAHCRFARLQDAGDLRIAVVEHLPKKERRALGGRQPFEQNQERHGDGRQGTGA
jgi:hypothetical protein